LLKSGVQKVAKLGLKSRCFFPSARDEPRSCVWQDQWVTFPPSKAVFMMQSIWAFVCLILVLGINPGPPQTKHLFHHWAAPKSRTYSPALSSLS
jgi:hypothetical protein